MTFRRKLAAAALAAALAAPVAAVVAAPACPEEDSLTLCRWDAPNRGNGAGVSFTYVPGIGALYY